MANENPGLAVVHEKISELTNRIARLEQSISDQKEEASISSLEQWVFQLKCSIIDVSLKVPETTTFARHINTLGSDGAIRYIIGLLRQCWQYANPGSLLSNPIKDLEQEDLLDKALSKYTSADCSDEDIVAQIDRNPSAAIIRYAQDKNDRSIYRGILDTLWKLCSPLCGKFGLHLTKDFLLRSVLLTTFSTSQLTDVFNLLVEYKYVVAEDLQDFISIFSCSITAREKPVRWMAKSVKNGECNYAALYVVFSSLGFKMTEAERKVIADVFIRPDGCALKYDSIKKRNDSLILCELHEQILKVLHR